MKLDALPPRIIPSNKEEDIKGYTEAIITQKMVLIFDLVLNHIAKDSLVIGKHRGWFKEQDDHWDDICPFNFCGLE